MDKFSFLVTGIQEYRLKGRKVLSVVFYVCSQEEMV